MQALVLTPQVKGSAAEKALARFDGDIIYLTNPLYQPKPVDKGLAAKVVTDDDLCAENRVFDELIEKTLRLSREWYLQGPLKQSFEDRGINLAQMVSLPLSKYLTGILRPLYLYGRLIETRKISRAHLVDDGGPWGEALVFLSSRRGVALSRQEIPAENHRASSEQSLVARALSTLLNFYNSLSVMTLKRSGIIFSSAPWYTMPILRRARSGYFLRPIFSEKAFLEGARHSFLHMTPDYFYSSCRDRKKAEARFEKIFRETDRYFSSEPYFDHDGLNIWPLIRLEMRRIICDELPAIARWADSFDRLIDRSAPRAVVVEEEVNPFNKTLVACANRKGIKTYCLLHSALIRKTGSVPSHVHRILAWGPSTRARLVEWGVSPERITETGAPQFDHMLSVDRAAARKKVLEDFSLPEDAYVVVLALSDLLTNESVVWKYPRASLFQDILERSLMISLGFVSRHPNVYLLIKAHPRYKHAWLVQEVLSRFDEATRSRTKIVTEYPSKDIVAASNLVLTTGSTVYFEAVLLKRPSMVFDYADNRFCQFISDIFLDLKDPESCWASLKSAMEKGEGQLADELPRHFVDRGRDAVSRVLNEIKTIGGN